MKTLKILWSIFSWVLFAALIALIILTISSNTSLISGYRTFLIQSGSMEPSIMTGDVVIVQNRREYFPGEVITFKNNQNRVITHRITEIESESDPPQFITKGDANRTDDEDIIRPENVLGKVILVVPKVGFLVAFTKSPIGFIALILFPAFLIIFSELVKIFRNA
jgi:signal peptidase I